MALGNNTKFYETPNHPFQSGRIAEERELLTLYGLKNKVELWRAQSELRSYRREARKHLASLDESNQEETLFLAKLKRYGIVGSDSQLDDILTLDVNTILERRLQTIVYRSGLANTIKQARQFVVHGHISLNGHCVDVPSYKVKVEEELSLQYDQYSSISDESHPIRKPPEPIVKEVSEEVKEVSEEVKEVSEE